MTGCEVPFFREIVEILAIERENAAQTGTMEQTESSDGMIWIFQGKSGKQTDSRSSVLIFANESFPQTLSSVPLFPFSFRSVSKWVYGNVARSPVRYVVRQRTEHRSKSVMTKAQFADAPRTVPLAFPYTHLQTAIKCWRSAARVGAGSTRLYARGTVMVSQFSM